jgi:hypothetical protein
MNRYLPKPTAAWAAQGAGTHRRLTSLLTLVLGYPFHAFRVDGDFLLASV